jgi:hypothetical protein
MPKRSDLRSILILGSGPIVIGQACKALQRKGVLEKSGVQLIGDQPQAIELAEDRLKFKEAMTAAGIGVPKSGLAKSLEEAEVGFPCLIRPSFTLGGSGAGVAYSEVNPRASRTVPFVSKVCRSPSSSHPAHLEYGPFGGCPGGAGRINWLALSETFRQPDI